MLKDYYNVRGSWESYKLFSQELMDEAKLTIKKSHTRNVSISMRKKLKLLNEMASKLRENLLKVRQDEKSNYD